jgi:hypothetical protein
MVIDYQVGGVIAIDHIFGTTILQYQFLPSEGLVFNRGEIFRLGLCQKWSSSISPMFF